VEGFHGEQRHERNMNKTKVMISGEWQKVTQKAVRWPCGVCGRSVGNNSIQCISCKQWVHRKCTLWSIKKRHLFFQ